MGAGRRRALYLAGPDVFSREAAALGERKKAVCASFGFEGLYPLDSDILGGLDHAAARRAIFDANVALIDRSDAILANITPFKGVDCDPGTAFEIGYAFAMKKAIFLYSACADTLVARHDKIVERLGLSTSDVDAYFRFGDFEVESFGKGVNLMLHEAASDGVVLSDSLRLEDLDVFEQAVACVATYYERHSADAET